MKKIFLFAACAAWTITSWAQLMAPTLSFPNDGSSIVDVNVRLTWNPALGGTVAGYQAEIDTDSNFTNPVSLPITGTSAKTSELDYNQVYYWRVRAQKTGGGFSAYSDFNSFTTFYNEFTGLGPSGADKNPKLNLVWDSIPGTTTYHYELDDDSTFASPVTGSVPHDPANFTDAGKAKVGLSDLVFGQKYYYRVYASHSNDQSGWSAVNSFTVLDVIALHQPDDLATNAEPKTTLRCNNTPGVTEYRFSIDDSPAFNSASPNFNLITVFDQDFNGKDFVDAVLERLYFGQTYYWRVQGVNASGASTWSVARSFTVIDEVTLTSPEDGATDVPIKDATFAWDKVAGTDQYEMQYDTVNTFATTKDIITPNDTNKVSLNLSYPSSSYHWRVRAIHSKDTSGWSPVYSFNTLSVGIAEENESYSYHLFPNPADEYIFLDFNSQINGNLRMELYSLTGEKVDEVNFGYVSGQRRMSYDVSSLSTGTYLLMLNLDGKIQSGKITIR